MCNAICALSAARHRRRIGPLALRVVCQWALLAAEVTGLWAVVTITRSVKVTVSEKIGLITAGLTDAVANGILTQRSALTADVSRTAAATGRSP